MAEGYAAYRDKMRKIADVNNAIAVLHWDKEVNLPPKGAPLRSQQIATLSGIVHDMFTAQDFESTVSALLDRNGLNEDEQRNVELTFKDLQKQKRFPTSFVIRRSEITSKAYHAWLKAREAKDYSLFSGPLQDLIEVKREECELIGYDDHPYDALLDEYEPGAKTAAIDSLFSGLLEELIPFVQSIRSKPQVEEAFLKKFYPKDKQWEYGLHILEQMGYDFQAGRQDLSPHPFTTNFSPEDVRVTTRIDEHDFSNMVWSCIHEGGHALYEQGIPVEQYGLPLGHFVSLGIHESQSRLWENNVGRSLPFWEAHYEELQNRFQENLGSVSLLDFYKAINRVSPGFIRTESDELHYHFHIIIRFEIEKGIVEGQLNANDLREAWNEKYKAYLGLDVPNDSIGILQDVHWAHGSIGYFPTYSMGSLYAAQFFAKAKTEIPGLIDQIKKGDTSALLSYLNNNIHRYGRKYNSDELCQRLTGSSLDYRYFMDYVKEKYALIYP